MRVETTIPGILGQKAPEWRIRSWIDADGNPTTVKLSDYTGKIVHLFCFQHWCPGCHSSGFPTLQKVMRAFKNSDDVAFVAVQTVFEGFDANTEGTVREEQLKYDLRIPMGHDPGNDATFNRSQILYEYRTGGTPWHVIIDRAGTVVYNDFHLDPNWAVKFIKMLAEKT